MQVKNPNYNSSGTIDLEIEHPTYGWIPFTASPDDTEPLGKELYTKAIAGDYGSIQPYVEPEPLPPITPSVVTMRQARLALLQAGVLPLVESAIASMESPAAQIEWDYSQEVNREQPLVKQLAEALNLTSDQLDNLFLEASKL